MLKMTVDPLPHTASFRGPLKALIIIACVSACTEQRAFDYAPDTRPAAANPSAAVFVAPEPETTTSDDDADGVPESEPMDEAQGPQGPQASEAVENDPDSIEDESESRTPEANTTDSTEENGDIDSDPNTDAQEDQTNSTGSANARGEDDAQSAPDDMEPNVEAGRDEDATPPDDSLPEEPMPPAQGPPQTRWVILLAGQTNMVGLGRVFELSLGQDSPVDDALIYFDSGTHNHPQARSWMPMAPGFGINAMHFGPELGLARALRAQWPDRPLAFIKVAEANTSVHNRWRPGADLFDRFINQTHGALAGLEGPTEIVGLVWMNGETDAVAEHSALSYGQSIIQFVHQIRMALGLPSLPVIASLMRPHPIWPFGHVIRDHTQYVGESLGNVDTIDTIDLPIRELEDVGSLESQATLTVGRRFGDALVRTMRVKNNQLAFGAQGEGGWFYLSRGPFGEQPMAFDERRGRWSSASFSVIGPDFIHPGVEEDIAVLRWVVPVSGVYRLDLSAIHTGLGGNGVSVRAEIAGMGRGLLQPTELFQDGAFIEEEVSLVQGQTLDIAVSGLRDVAYDTLEIRAEPELVRAD